MFEDFTKFIAELNFIYLMIGTILYLTCTGYTLFKMYNALKTCSFLNQTKYSTYISYIICFTIIVGQTLLLIYSISKITLYIEVAVIIWIVYISSLLILFLIFMALTSTQSLDKIDKALTTNVFLFKRSDYNTDELIVCILFGYAWYLLIVDSIFVLSTIFYVDYSLKPVYNWLLINGITMEHKSLFWNAKLDLIRTVESYYLSAVLQGLALVVAIICFIIFS